MAVVLSALALYALAYFGFLSEPAEKGWYPKRLYLALAISFLIGGGITLAVGMMGKGI